MRQMSSDFQFKARFVSEKAAFGDVVSRNMAYGRVRWFDRRVGYGFITESAFGVDVFFHHTAIQVPGAKIIRGGQRVIFDMCRTNRSKVYATNIIPIFERPEKLERYHAKLKANNIRH